MKYIILVLLYNTSWLSCSSCLGIDIDEEALKVCKRNIADCEIDNIDLLQLDICSIDPGDVRWYNKVDTVIMNPPFGTKNNEGEFKQNMFMATQMLTD